MSNFNNPIVIGYTESDTYRICAVHNWVWQMHHCTPLHSLGKQETKGWNQTPAQRMQIPESQSELEPLQQDECSVFPLLESINQHRKHCLHHREQEENFSQFAILLLTWQDRIPNPSLDSMDSFMQNTVLSSQNCNPGLSIFRNIPCCAWESFLGLWVVSPPPCWSN